MSPRLEHVPLRATQRYGLTLTPEQIADLEVDLALGRCRDFRCGRYAVKVHGRTVLVAARLGAIVTCLPPHALTREIRVDRR